jgi:hypothetical protein
LQGLFHHSLVKNEIEAMTAFPDIKRNDAKRLLALLASLSTSGTQDACQPDISRGHEEQAQ